MAVRYEDSSCCRFFAHRPCSAKASYTPPTLSAGLFLVQKSNLNQEWSLGGIFGAKPVQTGLLALHKKYPSEAIICAGRISAQIIGARR